MSSLRINKMTTNLIFKIRPFTQNDIEDIHLYASNPITTQYMLWGPNTIEDTQGFLNYVFGHYSKTPITNFEYGIEFEGKIIGGIALIVNYVSKSAEIGWILNEAYHRRGIVFQAAKEMIALAKSLGIETLHATADSRNVASYKLMEKLGMHHVSTTIHGRFNKLTGQYDLDQVYYELKLK